jgi:hypothetical protein
MGYYEVHVTTKFHLNLVNVSERQAVLMGGITLPEGAMTLHSGVHF